MQQSAWERVAAGTGLAFVVLLVFGAVIDPVADPTGDGAATVSAQLLDNKARVLLGVYAASFAALTLVWFAGSLRSTLRQAEGGQGGRLSAVAFAGAVMAAVAILASAAMQTGALELADYGNDAAGARLAASLARSLFFATGFGLALLVWATFVVAIRHAAIPRWLAWVGLVGAALAVVVIWPFFAIGFVIVLFWVAALSIVLIRKVDTGPAGQEGEARVET